MVNGNCAFVGCKNSRYRLRIWGKSACKEHTDQRKKDCPCSPPFTLHIFPSIKLNMEGRKEWTRLVNRMTRKQTEWIPGSSDMVCSRHFVDGRPTLENPDPVLNLGYDTPPNKSRQILKRIIPEEMPEIANQNIPNGEDYSMLDHDYRLKSGDHCLACLDKKEVIYSLANKVTELSRINGKLQQRVNELTMEVRTLKHHNNKLLFVAPTRACAKM